MPRFVPDHCQFRGGWKTRGMVDECQQPARYICPDGEVRTLVLYQSSMSRFLGPCHLYFKKASQAVSEQFTAMYPDFPHGYRLYEPSEQETKQTEGRQRWMRHALAEMMPQRQGGLKRMDNSGAESLGSVYIPQPEIRRL